MADPTGPAAGPAVSDAGLTAWAASSGYVPTQTPDPRPVPVSPVDAMRLTVWLSTTLPDLGVDGVNVITYQYADETTLEAHIGARRFEIAVTELPTRGSIDGA